MTKPTDPIVINVEVHVVMSWWDALKLRLAGVTFLSKYLEETLKKEPPK